MRIDRDTWDAELKMLFGALCDGLRQEVRYFSLMRLATNEELSLTEEREAHTKASLAFHLRTVGFFTLLESYFYEEPASRRPDLAVFLPANKRYLFLECKRVDPSWGSPEALEDMEKLNQAGDPLDRRNGLICFGFREPVKTDGFPDKYSDLSKQIVSEYPRYKEVAVKKINLGTLDDKATYAMIGLWVRKLR